MKPVRVSLLRALVCAAPVLAPGSALSQRAAVPPSAEVTVRAELESAPVVPRDEAGWLPMRVLQALEHSTHELAAPTSPRLREGTMLWSYLLPLRRDTVAPDAARQGALCDPLRSLSPGLHCAADLVASEASRRERVVVGWRLGGGGFAEDLGLPLRALARAQTGACVRSVERTLHTVELDLRLPDRRAVGLTLALLASVPGLTGVVLMGAEPLEGGLRTRLLWPTDGVDRERGTLGDDPWPERCEGRSHVAVDARPHEAFLVRAHLLGTRAQGAVIAAHGREWLVTEGDQLGDAVLTSITAQAVMARRGRGRPQAIPERALAQNAGERPRGSGRPSSVVPLPPEPPSAVQPLR